MRPSTSTLKKIPVQQLRMGMHLHKLDGAWLSHSFWRTRFRIENPTDLQRLHACGVAECWIDVAQGLDVAPGGLLPTAAEPVSTTAAAPEAVAPVPAAAAPASAPERQVPMAEELRQAAAICQRGRQQVVAMFNEARMGRTIDAERALPLVDEISNSVHRNPDALVSLARLKTRDGYSYMHSVAVCALMVALGRQQGLSDDRCREAGLAGLLHDVGKATIPLEILNKPGRLTDDEFAVVRSHPEAGHALLRQGGGATAEAMDVVLHHHEKIDGSGYPDRLSGDQISLLSRMGAICDVYDAITSNRPYKAGWDPAESIARMASWKGHFDETLFSAFVQSLGIYPTGSRVKLHSGKLAVVVEQNAENLVAPVVKVFYSTKAQMRIAPELLDLSRKGCHDRIVGRDIGDAGSFQQLDELWADPEVLQRLKS